MENSPAIQLEKVSVSFGKQKILDNLSLTIEKGYIQGIIGPSGAGKTTLLKIINGLIKPQSGTVKIWDQELNKSSLKKLRPKIGYVPQNMGLIKILSAKENVLLGGLARMKTFSSLLKIFPKKEMDFADHLLDVLKISHKIDTPAYKLSGGEKRRVAIARALMQHPNILLADEILSDLDLINSGLIMQKLRQLKKEFGLTIIMIEHNLCTIHEFSDHIALLKNGEITEKIPKAKTAPNQLCKLF